MKKNNIFKLLIMCFIVCLTFSIGLYYNNGTQVYAETVEDEIIEDEITEDDLIEEETDVTDQIFDDLMRNGYAVELRTDIEDTHLYSVLLQIIKDYIKETYSYNYTNSTLYSTMFRSFKEITIGEMAIESLMGLGEFKFNELETLTITNNSIRYINKDIFKNMPKLKTLNLACNNISDIDLSLATNLEVINLSSNNLSQIDLTKIEKQDININLANNNFTSMKDILLPTRINSINLNLIANNISDLTQDYFDFTKLTMSIGLQGVKSIEESISVDTSSSLNFFKTNMEGVELKIYKINPLEDVYVKTFKDSDIVNNSINIIDELAVGEYYVEYVLDNNRLYQSGHADYEYFKTYKFSVLPTTAIYKFEHKGKIYDNFDNKVTGKVKVMFECEEGGKILYKVNNSDWQEGTEVLCDKGGNYTVSTKVVKDGIESEVKTVVVRTSLNTIIPDGLMLVLILLFTIILFAVVVPLVSKKWFRK